MTTVYCIDVRAAVNLDDSLRALEMADAAMIGGARFNLGYADGSSIRLSPNDTPESIISTANLDKVINPLIAARARCLLIIGTDAPKWTAWKTATGGTWGGEVNRPPPEAWPYWCIDVQFVVNYVREAYRAAGLDPDLYVWFQLCNEPAVGGAGAPYASLNPTSYAEPYDSLASGELDGPYDGLGSWSSGFERNLGDQLAYLVQHVDFRGSPVVGIAHETETGTAWNNERASLYQVADHIPYLTHRAMNDYHGLAFAEALHEDSATARWVNLCWQELAELDAAYEAVVPGSSALPVVLSEIGITMDQLSFGSSTLAGYGHFARGDRLRRIIEALAATGRFAMISIYVSRERSSLPDGSLYGLRTVDGVKTGAHRAIAQMCGSVPVAPYSKASGEFVAVMGDDVA